MITNNIPELIRARKVHTVLDSEIQKINGGVTVKIKNLEDIREINPGLSNFSKISGFISTQSILNENLVDTRNSMKKKPETLVFPSPLK
ncbi:MAG TPA: hypothetical protein V6C58_14025 [Allocoleopsis sp.]